MPSMDSFSTFPLCGCPACAAETEADGGRAAALIEAVHDLDPSSPSSGQVGGSISGKPIWSIDAVAANLARPSGDWTQYNGNMQVSYWFPTDGDLFGTSYDGFNAAERAAAHRAMEYYADLTGLTFTQASDINDADLIFRNTNSQYGGGFAYFPNASPNPEHHTVNIGHYAPDGDGIAEGQYRFRLLLHELGHGLGLAHPGDYNGAGFTYSDHAEYWNDSRQYSNMSYWSQTNTGADFGHAGTPLLHDIVAIQREYGANMNTRSGNTVYGFNSTAGRDGYNLARDPDMAFAIWDGGGTDTLDFSGYAGATQMDLRQGAFSSGANARYNVAVAYGVTIENAIGGGGDDAIRGNGAANRLIGGNGDDVIRGQGGNDRLYGGANEDTLFGDSGDDRLYGGAHNDILRGGAGGDLLNGGSGTDQARYVSAAAGVVADLQSPGRNRGDAAGDRFSSVEQLYGSRHNDRLYGDRRDNTLWGHNGDDRLYGRSGDDVLNGMNGADVLEGQGGSDRLNGGGGDDILRGGAGGDLLNGGSGDDQASYLDAAAGLRADLQRSGQNTGYANGDRYRSIERLYGSEHDDQLYGDQQANTIWGHDGNDRLYGRAGDDMLKGMNGRDVLEGQDGNDRLYGGAGNDTLRGGAGRDLLNGGSGTDVASYTDAAAGVRADLQRESQNQGEAAGDRFRSIERLYGSDHDDLLRGDGGGNVIWGGDGDDRLYGRNGDDNLKGMNGEDVLFGQAGDDRLYGGAHDDVLDGGTGDDLLNGGSGSDILVFRADDGDDRVQGFQDGADMLRFVGLTESDLSISSTASGTVISYNGGSVELQGVDASLINQDDFIFV